MADKHDRFVAEIEFRANQMEAGVKRAGQVLESFDVTSTKVFEKFAKVAEDNLRRAGQQAEKEAKNFQKFADDQAKAVKRLTDQMATQDVGDLSGGLGDIAGRGQQLVGSFLTAGSQMEQFRLTLVALLGSTEAADKELAKLQRYANVSPFDIQSVVAAGVQLRSFKVDVDRFLPLAGDLAAVFGRDLQSSALALGKALGGSSEGIEILNDSFGLTRKELKAAGAIINSTGSIANQTEKEVAALAAAIEKIAAQKGFAGAVAVQMGTLKAAASQTQDSFFNLSAAIGTGLAPAFIPLTNGLTTTIDGLTKMPPALLAAVGGAVALGTAMATGGAALLGLQAGLATLAPVLGGTALGFTAAELAAGAAAASFGGLLALGGVLAVGAAGIVVALNDEAEAAKAVGDQIKRQSQEVTYANGVFQQYRDIIEEVAGASQNFITQGQTAEQTATEVAAALAGLSGSELLSGLEKAGIKLSDVSAEMQAAEKNGDALRLRLRDVNQALAMNEALESGKGLPREIFSQQQLSDFKDIVARELNGAIATTENLKAKQKELQAALAETRQVAQGVLKPINDNGTKAEAAFKGISDGAKTLASDLKLTVDTSDLKSLDDGYAQASKAVQDFKSKLKATSPEIDTSSLTGLKKQLASGSDATEVERNAIKDLIALIEVRNGLETKGQAIRQKGARDSLAAQLDEVQGLETARERLAALQKIAAAEGISADAKRQVMAQIRQEQKAITAEQKAASKEQIQQAIFEAQSVEGGAQAKINAIQRVLDAYKLEASTRRQLLKEIDSLQDELAKKEAARRKAEADGLASESQRQQELLIAALDDRIANLQEEAEAGKNVQAGLVAAMEERTAREIALIEERTKARAAEADSAKVADQIEVTGALEVEAARRAGTEAIENQKKAQQARIDAIRAERKEALKAAADEKKARDDIGKTIRSQARSQQADTAPAPARPAQEWVNPIPNSPFSAPPSQSQGLSFPTLNFGISEDVRARADEIKAGRAEKEAERKAAFEAANPELVQRIFEEDLKRREELSKKDAERQEAARKTAEADVDADSARRAAAQLAADNARRSDAIDRTAVAQVRPHTPDEIAKQFQLLQPATPKIDLSKFAPLSAKGIQISDPFQAALDRQKAAGKAPGQKEATAATKASAKGGINGTLTVELEIKGAQVVNAKVKGKSADLDGKVSDIARMANKITFRVNT